MSENMKILLIQEKDNKVKFLKEIFETDILENKVLKIMKDYKTALEEILFYGCDIIVIDSEIKNITIKYFCEKVRKNNNKVGIICITDNTDLSMKLDLLEVGIDDYFIKPFDKKELLLKVKNLYKRIRTTEVVKDLVVYFHNFSLDTLKRELKKEEKIIALSSKEFSLLEYFVRNKNILITREEIKREIWGDIYRGRTNIVDVYINKLRKKIVDEEGKILQVVRGKGYIFKE